MKLPNFGRARARLTTSADVAAEIEQHTTMLAEAKASLGRLDADRHEVMIGDDVGAIREHKVKSEEARTAVERVEARLVALDTQAAEIRAAETEAALTARRTAAEARAVEIVGWWRDAYPDMARLLVSALQELAATDREIAGVNADLIAAERHGDVLRGAEDRINPDKITEPPGGIYVASPPLAGNTRLVELPKVGAPGWGPPLGVPRW